MKLDRAIIEKLTVRPGRPADLPNRSTTATRADWPGKVGTDAKERAEEDLRAFVDELEVRQELLWASGTCALLVIFQGMDAAGKDGTIKHVMSGINPQGFEVVSFGQPTTVELGHDFLWRHVPSLPARGRIGIFNRSYYQEVLVVRVHPELLAREGSPAGRGHHEHLWRHRYEDINAFEQHLDRDGTRIVKFFLHLSKEEQKRRLLERLDDPAKHWKFSSADLAERQHWDEYQDAYEEALTATSTPWAPWYVVPADHKNVLRALVGGVVVHAIDQMDLQPRPVEPGEREARDRARAALLAE
jgi:PPK2 family polyphosphate:nucleotide phosphotransferase